MTTFLFLEHQQQAPSSAGPRVGGRTRGGRAGPGRVQPVRGHALECAEYGQSGGLPFHPERMPSFEKYSPASRASTWRKFPTTPAYPFVACGFRRAKRCCWRPPTCRVRCMPTTGTKTAIVNMWARWSEAPLISENGRAAVSDHLPISFKLNP